MNIESLHDFAENFTSVDLIPKTFEDDELDVETYNWYLSRFNMFVEDGVPLVINEYLNKLVRDRAVNDYTISRIQLAAMRIIMEEN